MDAHANTKILKARREQEVTEMIHPITLEELAKGRQKDLLDEAKRFSRQAQVAQPARPGLFERVTDRVGTLLAGVGQRLSSIGRAELDSSVS